MGKKQQNPDWAEARQRCNLTDDVVHMAQELGMTPHSLIKNIPSARETRKAPVADWVRGLYEKKHGGSKLAGRAGAVKFDDAEDELRATPFDAVGEFGELERDYNEFLRQEREPPGQREIKDQNALMLRRQRNLRTAAEYM